MSTEPVWLEKYRSKDFDEVAGQEEVIKKLKAYVVSKNFPNLLFSGPPGVGKTTCAIILAKKILGSNWNGNFKELNASDERGIDVVRGQIKSFASTESLGNVDFKIIFLDEADALTSDAQSALRRTMEKYTYACRFILSCNYSSKVIEPIQSRCAVYRFRGIDSKAMKERLKYIASKENLVIEDDALDAIVYVSDFDMRKAISTLEISSLTSKTISVESIYKSSNYAKPEQIRSFINESLKGNFMIALEKLEIMTIIDGLEAADILSQMMKEILIINLDDQKKVDCIDSIGECDFRIAEGASSTIQMKWLIAKMMNIGK